MDQQSTPGNMVLVVANPNGALEAASFCGGELVDQFFGLSLPGAQDLSWASAQSDFVRWLHSWLKEPGMVMIVHEEPGQKPGKQMPHVLGPFLYGCQRDDPEGQTRSIPMPLDLTSMVVAAACIARLNCPQLPLSIHQLAQLLPWICSALGLKESVLFPAPESGSEGHSALAQRAASIARAILGMGDSRR